MENPYQHLQSETSYTYYLVKEGDTFETIFNQYFEGEDLQANMSFYESRFGNFEITPNRFFPIDNSLLDHLYDPLPGNPELDSSIYILNNQGNLASLLASFQQKGVLSLNPNEYQYLAKDVNGLETIFQLTENAYDVVYIPNRYFYQINDFLTFPIDTIGTGITQPINNPTQEIVTAPEVDISQQVPTPEPQVEPVDIVPAPTEEPVVISDPWKGYKTTKYDDITGKAIPYDYDTRVYAMTNKELDAVGKLGIERFHGSGCLLKDTNPDDGTNVYYFLTAAHVLQVIHEDRDIIGLNLQVLINERNGDDIISFAEPGSLKKLVTAYRDRFYYPQDGKDFGIVELYGLTDEMLAEHNIDPSNFFTLADRSIFEEYEKGSTIECDSFFGSYERELQLSNYELRVQSDLANIHNTQPIRPDYVRSSFEMYIPVNEEVLGIPKPITDTINGDSGSALTKNGHVFGVLIQAGEDLFVPGIFSSYFYLFSKEDVAFIREIIDNDGELPYGTQQHADYILDVDNFEKEKIKHPEYEEVYTQTKTDSLQPYIKEIAEIRDIDANTDPNNFLDEQLLRLLAKDKIDEDTSSYSGVYNWCGALLTPFLVSLLMYSISKISSPR